jgi:hypothetical protein
MPKESSMPITPSIRLVIPDDHREEIAAHLKPGETEADLIRAGYLQLLKRRGSKRQLSEVRGRGKPPRV